MGEVPFMWLAVPVSIWIAYGCAKFDSFKMDVPKWFVRTCISLLVHTTVPCNVLLGVVSLFNAVALKFLLRGLWISSIGAGL
jgi:hypothetical protein